MLRLTGARQLEIAARRDHAPQPLRLFAVARDHPGERIEAVRLQGEPHLERAESARQLGSILAEPRLAVGQAALRRRQVVAPGRERGAVRGLVLHQHAARVVRHLQPFVEIEGDGIGPAMAASGARNAGSSAAKPPKAASM